VSCAIGTLASGQGAPVNIVVTPISTGTITNSVSITGAPGNPDPNAANNSASSTFQVVSPPAAPAPKCVVPKLAGTPKGVATKVLGLLDCKVKVRSSHSTKYHKGTVIKSTPGSGKYAAKKSITVFVSSGPPPKKKKKH
jgi:beta-lactam-binding protein with PASTA domain